MTYRLYFQSITAKFYRFADLDGCDQELLWKANKARLNAQAPYSNYLVGAAVRSQDRIHTGCNVERASYSQTSHAEQNAIDSMVAAEGPVKIQSIAIIGAPVSVEIDLNGCVTGEPEVIAPSCGHCLQIIWENCYSDPGVRLICRTLSGHIMITKINDAFPFPFGPEDLGINYAKK